MLNKHGRVDIRIGICMEGILDMDLPKHSFAFMRRDELTGNKISCIYASAYLKKNTDSLKNAVENDLFSSAPNVDQILGIKDI